MTHGSFVANFVIKCIDLDFQWIVLEVWVGLLIQTETNCVATEIPEITEKQRITQRLLTVKH